MPKPSPPLVQFLRAYWSALKGVSSWARFAMHSLPFPSPWLVSEYLFEREHPTLAVTAIAGPVLGALTYAFTSAPISYVVAFILSRKDPKTFSRRWNSVWGMLLFISVAAQTNKRIGVL